MQESIETMSDFDLHFKAVYGPRWTALKEALLGPSPKVSRACFGDYAHYTLDQASVLAALALPLNPGERVLDMCAAPGGKALVLAEKLQDGELLANELSFARRKRLEEVIRTHVPPEVQKKIKITSWDASKIGIRAPQSFDKILLDAPCSSERHLLSQDPQVAEWKISRTKQLAQRQYALLCSALLALKPNGLMLYSTCSISPLENDGVVERLLERKGDQAQLAPIQDQCFEKMKFGYQIFPDLNAGQGPIYFSLIQKKPSG